jgi:hypothetical protein
VFIFAIALATAARACLFASSIDTWAGAALADPLAWVGLLGATLSGPPELEAATGAVDLALTVNGKAGMTREFLGPGGGGLAAPYDTADVSAWAVVFDTGARAAGMGGFDSSGGVGPGAGDTFDMGVTGLGAPGYCARSFTGSSLGG